MAVRDIVPVSGAGFEQTLASASPDVLREMIRQFAQRMMDADVEVACDAGYGEVTADRVNSRNGYRRREWDTRAAWCLAVSAPRGRPLGGSVHPQRDAPQAMYGSPASGTAGRCEPTVLCFRSAQRRKAAETDVWHYCGQGAGLKAVAVKG